MYKLSIFFFLLPFVSLAQSSFHHMNPTSSRNTFTDIMERMMMKMDEIASGTSADKDFLLMMIPHHQGAVDMAGYQITHGHNPEMIQLAKSIKAEQLVQIQQMQLLIAGQPVFTSTGIQHQKANKEMMALMMDNMPAANKSLNTDKAFAATMIPHHQAAIGMAKVELQYGIQKNQISITKHI